MRDSHERKMMQRLVEVQQWLNLSEAELSTWRRRTLRFLGWLLEQAKREGAFSALSERVRALFPLLWQEFDENDSELLPL